MANPVEVILAREIMKLPINTTHVAYVCLLALALLAASWPCSKQEVPAPGWELAEFIDHLHAQGIRFRVIPERHDGSWSNSAFLTEDPEETWASCQSKPKVVDCIGRWRGSIWVQRIGCVTNTEGLLWQWGEYGCRIGDFLLFGDEQILGRVRKAFR
jgi:hypothetical protein